MDPSSAMPHWLIGGRMARQHRLDPTTEEQVRDRMKILAAILALAVAALATALWAYRDIPATTLEARYTGPASKFIYIDGARIHYRDQGSGPVVVLIHGNFSNLIDWDPWVDALEDRYRVVRFDLTSHGLTGPDPTGDYSQERTLALTARLIDALGLRRISIGGTSLGGTIAVHYAAAHPERVARLILLNPGMLEGKEMARRGGVPKAAYLLKYILPRALPAAMLRSGFGDPSKVSDALIDRWYDLWMREGQRQAQLDRLSQYRAGDVEAIIRSIRVPVLLLWGEADSTAPIQQAQEFLKLLGNAASVKFIKYPGVGHMAVEEAGAETGRDLRAWLDATATSPGG
ncbi:MAG: alpha/beta hydrolase [Proteobacteria bacterium]|nr:MAG: alpha/beta hydrolase [Pseudomonadota bacterium]MBC6944628.1 alpha/beta hydrolase [Gammaproteobacteria bacterium]